MRKLKNYKSLLWSLAAHAGLENFPDEVSGVDVFLPFMEKARADGAVVILKLDGERTHPADNGPYTAVITNRAYPDEFWRMDSHTVEDALSYVLVEYAKSRWGFVPENEG